MMHPGPDTVPVSGAPSGSSPARLWRGCDGTTAVEAAFVLPLLLLVLLGIVEFGRAIWIQTSLQYAVTAAARCAAVNSPTCTNNVPSYAASQVYGLSIPSADFTYTSGASCGNTGYVTGSQVTVNYTFTSVVGTLIPRLASVPLSATACHP
jgi:Flp pilus assembly protein TadG